MPINSHLNAYPMANYLTILCNSFTVKRRLDTNKVKHPEFMDTILVLRGRAPFGQHQELRPGQVQRHSGFEWLCKHERLRPEPIRLVTGTVRE